MPPKCSVPGCRTGYASQTKDPSVSVHRYPHFQVPSDQELGDKWIEVIGPKNVPTVNSGVCSLHFKPEDFITISVDSGSGVGRERGRKLKKRRLKPYAVPSIFNTVHPVVPMGRPRIKSGPGPKTKSRQAEPDHSPPVVKNPSNQQVQCDSQPPTFEQFTINQLKKGKKLKVKETAELKEEFSANQELANFGDAVYDYMGGSEEEVDTDSMQDFDEPNFHESVNIKEEGMDEDQSSMSTAGDLYQKLSKEKLPSDFTLLSKDSKILLAKIAFTLDRGPVITSGLQIDNDLSFTIFSEQCLLENSLVSQCLAPGSDGKLRMASEAINIANFLNDL